MQILRREGEDRFDPETLARLDGLRPHLARAAVLAARSATGLLGGRSIEELATDGGVSVHTVRAKVKSLLAKSGSRRQAEFVLQLSSAIGVVGRPTRVA